ncbi:ClpP/crotonase-like domain-containing protein [Helicostylum pulchrum]|nr:ClpP/crotonase-like domain-containing protein [Helicostylum pulchrum]
MNTNNKQDILSEEPAVVVIKCKGYSHIVLNRPDNLNTINPQLTSALLTSLITCEEDEDTRFIILRGSGRAFSAGGDIKEIVSIVESGRTNDIHFDKSIRVFYETLFYMGCVMKTPVISFMNGITVGGGIGISQLTAFKIATENTTFCLPEALIGHFCDVGSSFTVPRMEGYLGVYLALTGHSFKAEDALFAGFATHFMVSENITALEKKLSEQEDITLDIIDSIIQEFSASTDHDASHYRLYGDILQIIERCFKYSSVQEIMNALEKEGTEFTERCLKSIKLCSPTSLQVIIDTISQGKSKSMAQCLNYEYRLWCNLPYAHDYREGVHALLEKRRPQWIPSTLDEIDSNYIQSNFFIRVRSAPSMDLSQDFTTSPYKRFHLPTFEEVIDIQKKYGLKTRKEIIGWFLNDRKGKFGVKQKVTDILDRNKIGSTLAKI